MAGRRRLARDTAHSHWWGAMVLLLVLGAPLLPLLLNGCTHTIPTGLYLSLRHAYFPVRLDDLQEAAQEWPLKTAYLELGVFDPEAQVFRDFARTFEVSLTHTALEGPVDALRAAPARLKRELPHHPDVLAWIYLHHADSVSISPPLETTAGGVPLSTTPAFSLQNSAHRQALADAVVALKQMGFQGVHLDLEPFPKADAASFCTLIDQLRSRTKNRFVYSVFTPKYLRNVEKDRINPGYVWQDVAPFQQLELCADQLMVPLYDYGDLVKTPEQYRRRVAEARNLLLPSLKRPRQLWFALPAFRNTLEHGPAETLESALQVLTGPGDPVGGISFFLYTGEPDETWYRQDWAQ